MKRFRRCVAATAMAVAAVAGIQQHPAGAVSAGVLSGSGWMSNASGPGTTGTTVSGTISGTVIGTFGSWGFSFPFGGNESIVQGIGGGGPIPFPSGPCGFFYSRNLHAISAGGGCSWGSSWSGGGTAEPSSALPTSSYNFQILGQHAIDGPIVINGNMTFAPGAPVGLTAGTLLPTSTTLTFSGTITGLLGPGFVGSCSLSMSGGGSESITTGSSVLHGACSGPFGSTPCVMQWTHLATHTMITGNCSGPLGFTVAGTGEIVMGPGGGYSLYAAIAVI